MNNHVGNQEAGWYMKLNNQNNMYKLMFLQANKSIQKLPTMNQFKSYPLDILVLQIWYYLPKQK